MKKISTMQLMKRLFLCSVSLAALSACATLHAGAETVCAKKAETQAAAQAVIDALNKYCPLESAEQ